MAAAAGIEMTECRLLEEGGRAHFMTRRFDRTPEGAKIHVQSLCAQIQMNANGEVNRIFNTYLNVAKARVRGIDYEAVYRMEPNFFASQSESLTIRALAGYVAERSDTPLGAPNPGSTPTRMPSSTPHTISAT